MKTTLVCSFFALALTALGASYHVTISDPTWVGSNQLMPGDYTVEVQGDKAVMKSGKNVVEVPAKVETETSKYPVTSLHSTTAGGKNTLEEIWVGGTKTKIVLK
jgi:hypothetical protein